MACAAVQWGLFCRCTRHLKHLSQETKMSSKDGFCTGQVRNVVASIARALICYLVFVITHNMLQRWWVVAVALLV